MTLKKKRSRSQNGRRSRQKGASFERAVARKLRNIFPKVFRRLEFQANVTGGYDLEETGNLLVQCKAYKDYAPISKIREITSRKGIPVLVTKGDRKKPMVVISLDDFTEILADPITAFHSEKESFETSNFRKEFYGDSINQQFNDE